MTYPICNKCLYSGYSKTQNLTTNIRFNYTKYDSFHYFHVDENTENNKELRILCGAINAYVHI